MTDQWREDILGPGFQQRTLSLTPEPDVDDERVVATLVRHLPDKRKLFQRRRPLEDVDVLYVHGWSDYFFQTRLAKFWTARGARFYAIDLRRYGRSFLPGQKLCYISNLHTYDEDLAAALAVMREEDSGPRRLVLMGHSTGGLVISLWADRHPGVASALVLNSPWLEFQLGPHTRTAIRPVAEWRSRRDPLATAPAIDYGYYSRAQREVYDPEDPYSIVEAWRPPNSAPIHAGWIKAVLDGHGRVADGLSIDVPICTMLSTKFVAPTRWSEELTSADSVLVVERIAEAAMKLGPSVSFEMIEGAIHDIFLSRRDVRQEAYNRLDRWVRGPLPQF